ncbi:hypothetical protein [uncultured Shewanella sp.]|uniref:hypothetical protein n=1 Tax=uncultured Shewanella sp. TaxID=173975 RepID=UPI00261DF474|nr:hypothetical protein [uncultured Shewanella sp.]
MGATYKDMKMSNETESSVNTEKNTVKETITNIFHYMTFRGDSSLEKTYSFVLKHCFLLSIFVLISFILRTSISNNEIINQQSVGEIIKITSTNEMVEINTTEGTYFTQNPFNLSVNTEAIIVEKDDKTISLCNNNQTQCSILVNNPAISPTI